MTGYKFERLVFDWLAIHVSHVKIDQRHIKVVLANTTPLYQSTLNLYIIGSFEVSVRAGGVVNTQIMEAGQSSLDLILELPAGAIVTERALTAGSIRYCLEPIKKGTAWSKKRVDLIYGQSLQAKPGELLIPMRPEAVNSISGPTTVFVVQCV